MPFIIIPPIPYPMLPGAKLPVNEQNYATFIQRLIMNLGNRCVEFKDALDLFDFFYKQDSYPQEYNQHKRWLNIAANAAATAIFLFDEDMEFIGKNLSCCEVLRGMIDWKARKSATRKFKQCFPGFDGIRHSRQHDAKLYGTPERLIGNLATSLVETTDLVDRTIHSSFNGSTVTLEVSQVSLKNLEEVRDLYWSVFSPISTR